MAMKHDARLLSRMTLFMSTCHHVVSCYCLLSEAVNVCFQGPSPAAQDIFMHCRNCRSLVFAF